MSCGISSSFPEVFPTSGQVTHVLLTRPPLDWKELPPSASFDLHVLSTPPAFILSQDQTLQLNSASLATRLNFESDFWHQSIERLMLIRIVRMVTNSRVSDF